MFANLKYWTEYFEEFLFKIASLEYLPIMFNETCSFHCSGNEREVPWME